MISNLDDIPRPFNTTFIEREKELCSLIEGLNNPNVRNVQINGLGGIGKTSFVRDFCDKIIDEKVKPDFPIRYIVWVTGKLDYFEPSGKIRTIRNTRLSYSEMLKTFSAVYDIDSFGKSNDEITNEIYEKLKHYPSLLVYDNMETIDDPQILDFCKNVPVQTRLLFTTRANLQDITFATIYMNGFDLQQFGAYIEAKISTRERSEWANYLNVINPHIAELHSLTKGSPALIDFVLGKLCNGCDISTLISHLEKLQDGDDYYDSIMEFCFNSSYETLGSSAIDALFVMSISDEESEVFSVSDLCYILNKNIDQISELLEKLHGISFVANVQGKYQCPVLVRAFANKKISKERSNGHNDLLASNYYKWRDRQTKFEESEDLHYNRVKAYNFQRKVAVADIRDIVGKYDPKEDYGEAMKQFERVLNGCPEYGFVYFERAKFEAEGENYDLARSDYEKAIKFDPTNDYYLSQYGYFLLEQAKIDYKKKSGSKVKLNLAIDCFQKALAINPNHPNIHQGLAWALAKSLPKDEIAKRRKEIENHFEKGYYAGDDHGNNWRNARNAHSYADFLYQIKDYKKADAICKRGLKFSPQDHMLLSLQGRIQPHLKAAIPHSTEITLQDLNSGIFAGSSKETLEKLQSIYNGE